VSARLKITPTTRTLAKLRADGWLVDIVERRERYKTEDCYGCWDILGLRQGILSGIPEVILVQCTSLSGGNFSARVKKCRANENTAKLLACGVRCEVWGWREDKPEPRIERLTVRAP
jgi:hypothetical protein